MKMFYIGIPLLILASNCAGPVDPDGRSPQSAAEDSQTASNLSLGTDGDSFVPGCSRDISDIAQPPQKPYLVFAYNNCSAGKVPASVSGCNVKLVQANNANLTCNTAGDLMMDGVIVGTGGFICVAANAPSIVPGCNPNILAP